MSTGAGGGPRKYLLTGVAKCGICGLGMVTAYLRGKKWTYACTSGKHVAKAADSLEYEVTETILATLESTPLPELAAHKNAPRYSELSKEAHTLHHRLDSLARRVRGPFFVALAEVMQHYWYAENLGRQTVDGFT